MYNNDNNVRKVYEYLFFLQKLPLLHSNFKIPLLTSHYLTSTTNQDDIITTHYLMSPTVTIKNELEGDRKPENKYLNKLVYSI